MKKQKLTAGQKLAIILPVTFGGIVTFFVAFTVLFQMISTPFTSAYLGKKQSFFQMGQPIQEKYFLIFDKISGEHTIDSKTLKEYLPDGKGSTVTVHYSDGSMLIMTGEGKFKLLAKNGHTIDSSLTYQYGLYYSNVTGYAYGSSYRIRESKVKDLEKRKFASAAHASLLSYRNKIISQDYYVIATAEKTLEVHKISDLSLVKKLTFNQKIADLLLLSESTDIFYTVDGDISTFYNKDFKVMKVVKNSKVDNGEYFAGLDDKYYYTEIRDEENYITGIKKYSFRSNKSEKVATFKNSQFVSVTGDGDYFVMMTKSKKVEIFTPTGKSVKSGKLAYGSYIPGYMSQRQTDYSFTGQVNISSKTPDTVNSADGTKKITLGIDYSFYDKTMKSGKVVITYGGLTNQSAGKATVLASQNLKENSGSLSMSFELDPSVSKGSYYDFTVTLYDAKGQKVNRITDFIKVSSLSDSSSSSDTSDSSTGNESSLGNVTVNKTTPNDISRSKKTVSVTSNISYDLGDATSGKIVITYDEGGNKVVATKSLTAQTGTIDIPFTISTTGVSNYYDYTVTMLDQSGKVIDQSSDYIYINGSVSVGA